MPATAVALLPTPRATDGTKGGPNQRGSSGDLMLPSAVQLLPTPRATDGRRGRDRNGDDLSAKAIERADSDWGRHAPAIRRWEQVVGRPAPPPTITGQRGGRKLNPDLTDWMMGWPQGWTDVPGVTVNDRLRLCGNGVVRQQAVAALRWLLGTLR